HLFRRCQTSEVQERLRQVQVQDHFVTNPAAADLAESRIAQDHRNAYAFIVGAALIPGAMFTEIESVVAGVNDDGIRRDSKLIHRIKQTAKTIVSRADTAEVIKVH